MSDTPNDLNDTEKTNILFKNYLGFPSTKDDTKFYFESTNVKYNNYIIGDDVLVETIPLNFGNSNSNAINDKTALNTTYDISLSNSDFSNNVFDVKEDSSGIILKFTKLKLTTIPNAETGFYCLDGNGNNVLQDAIQYNYNSYKDGGATVQPFLYTLYANNGTTPIEFSDGNWVFDIKFGVVTFYDPDKFPGTTFTDYKDNGIYLTFYKYVGKKGIANLDNGVDLTGWQDASLNNLDISGNVTLKGANSKFIGDVSGNATAIVPSYWAKLGADIDGEAGDYSGYSVSLNYDGTIVAIGAPYHDSHKGFVSVYQNINGTWEQLGVDIDGETDDDESGHSVSLNDDGTIVAIGAHKNDDLLPWPPLGNAGHVRVYEYTVTDNVGSWGKIGQDIKGTGYTDYSGWSVSLSSDGYIVAIGAKNNDDNAGPKKGYVRVYEYNGADTWSKLGADINGKTDGDESGYSVSLSSNGSIVAIGAPKNGDNGADSGHVRVYQRNSSNTNVAPIGWTQLGVDISGAVAGDKSGWSVSLSSNGTIVAIGAKYNDDGPGVNSGHVRVYEYTVTDNVGSWGKIGQDIVGEADADYSGHSVSLSSDGYIVAIGAIQNDGNGGSISGHVRVYKYTVDTWIQLGVDIDGEAAEDYSGWSVSLSSDGSIVAIGAKSNGDGGVDSGHVRVYGFVGNAASATTLKIARTIGGVSFNGSENIDLPGVNIIGNQDTTGNAASATILQTARTIGGVSFNGSENIDLSGVNIIGNQDTTGNAATATALTSGDKTIDGALTIGDADNYTKIDANNNFISLNKENGHSQYIHLHKSLIDLGSGGNKNWDHIYLSFDDTVGGGNNQFPMFYAKIELYGTYNNTGVTTILLQKSNYGVGTYSYFSSKDDFDIDSIKLRYKDGDQTNKLYIDIEVNSDNKAYCMINVEIYDAQNGSGGFGVSNFEILGTDKTYTAWDTVTDGHSESAFTERSYRYKTLEIAGEAGDAQWKKKLTTTGATGQYLGTSIATSYDGSRIIVGTANQYDVGKVNIYDYDGSSWVSNGNISGVTVEDRFGSAVAMSSDGNRIVVGAYKYDDAGYDEGKVYIYDLSGTSWVSNGNIIGKNEYDYFGYSVAMSSDGNRIVVGAYGYGSLEGKVYIYDYAYDGSWNDVGTLPNGEASNDYFGNAVAMRSDGNRIVVGAYGGSGLKGRVYIYDWNGTSWSEVGTITGEDVNNNFSWHSMAMSSDGNRIVVGAYKHDDYTGKVYIYDYNGSSWVEIGTITGEASNDYFGFNVAIFSNKNRIAVNVYQGGNNDGNIKIYEQNIDTTWTQLGDDIDEDDVKYIALSPDGSYLLLGCPTNESNKGQFSIYKQKNILNAEINSNNIITRNLTVENMDINGGIIGNFNIINGNVQSALHVAGPINNNPQSFGVHMGTESTGNCAIEICSKSAIGGVSFIDFNNDDTTNTDADARIKCETNTRNLKFCTGGTDTKMTLASNGNLTVTGNVGIGTNNPTHKLEVDGDTKLDGILSIDAQWINKLTTTGTDSQSLGNSIATSYDGSRIIVGAPSPFGSGPTPKGNVYIYDYDGSSLSGIETISGENMGDQFGYAVAMSSDGNRIVVGAHQYDDTNGKVYIYDLSGTSWVKDETPLEGENSYYFGHDVAMSSDGNRIVVGAYGVNINQGEVYIYDYDGSSWNEVGTFTGQNQNDYYGYNVAMSSEGNRIVVGAYRYTSSLKGKIYIYDYDGSSWNEVETFMGQNNTDYFGYNVAMSSDGNRIVVGAHRYDSYKGKVYIYDYNGSSWDSIEELTGEANYDYFGYNVAIFSNKNRIAVNVYKDGNATGNIKIYEYKNNTWILLHTINEDGVKSLAISPNGSYLLLGCPNNGANNEGDFSIYKQNILNAEINSDNIITRHLTAQNISNVEINSDNIITRHLTADTINEKMVNAGVTIKNNLIVNEKVGIGTDNPQSALHVAGTRSNNPQSAGVHMGMNDTNNCAIEICCNGAAGKSYIDFNNDDSTNTDADARILCNTSLRNLQFSTGGYNAKMILDSNGSLGVERLYLDLNRTLNWADEIGGVGTNNHTTYMYTNFTGQHSNYGINEIINNVGFIVRSTGNYRNQMKHCNECNKHKISINESLPIVEYPSKANDKAVWGVISNKEDDGNKRYKVDGHIIQGFDVAHEDRPLRINSLGEGAMWVTNVNGAIENGDFMTSSLIPGLAMRQNDDLLHNYTVAKITMDCNFDDEQRPAKQLRYETVQTTDASGVTTDISQGVIDPVTQQFVYDLVYDDSGNQVFVDKYDEKWIRVFADKYVIYNDEAETDEHFTYEFDFANASAEHAGIVGNQYQMAFVGCTYHCG